MLHHRLRAVAGNRGNGIPTDGLIVWYTMDNISGSTLIDEMSNYNGTISGSNPPTPAVGIIGNGLSFAGGGNNTSYVSTGITPAQSQSLSISLWCRLEPENDPAQAYQFIFGSRTPTSRYYLLRTDTGFGIGLGASGTATGDYPIPGLSQWVHACWVQSGTTVNLYINGVLSGSKNQSFSVPSITLGGLNRPSFSTVDNCLNGLLDQVRVYNRQLTPAEITALYNEV